MAEKEEECPLVPKDSGVPVKDSGVPVKDSGVPNEDAEPEIPDAGRDASDAGDAAAAANCGATDTTTCSATSGITGRSFTGAGALQSAINATTGADFIMVRGHCPAATVTGRVGVTIQGPFPATGCGINGPGRADLTAEIDGLTVVGSTGVTVNFLNLVNSATDGVSFTNSSSSTAFCNCAARNFADGFESNNSRLITFTSNLSELNTDGFQANGSTFVTVASNTANANTGTGILVVNSNLVSVVNNIVTNNGTGINFIGSQQGTASANTLTGNGNQNDNLINCSNSSVFGSNVPINNPTFCGLSILVPTPLSM
jgi:hypothetical protein